MFYALAGFGHTLARLCCNAIAATTLIALTTGPVRALDNEPTATAIEPQTKSSLWRQFEQGQQACTQTTRGKQSAYDECINRLIERLSQRVTSPCSQDNNEQCVYNLTQQVFKEGKRACEQNLEPAHNKNQCDSAMIWLLARLGQHLCHETDYKSCLGVFTWVQEFDPWEPHAFFVAEALTGLGRLKEGVAAWEAVLATEPSNNLLPQVNATRDMSQKRVKQYQPLIPEVHFVLAEGYSSTATVTWADVPLTSKQLKGGIQVNPGTYVLEVKAPGYQRLLRVYQLSRSERKTVKISLTPSSADPAGIANPATKIAPRSRELVLRDPAPLPENGINLLRASQVGAGAISLLSLGVATVIRQNANAEADKVRQDCPDRVCTKRELDQAINPILRRTDTANLLFATGGIAAGAAAALVLWELYQAEDEPGPTVSLTPFPSGGYIRYQTAF